MEKVTVGARMKTHTKTASSDLAYDANESDADGVAEDAVDRRAERSARAGG